MTLIKDLLLSDPKIASTIFKNLSREEVRSAKGVSRTFYNQGTEYLVGNLDEKNKNRHLKRIIPPSNVIQREQQVKIDTTSLNSLITRLKKGQKGSPEEFEKFNIMMEQIRLAVQSNLGLSRVEREKHETFHSILVKQGSPVFTDVLQAPDSDESSIIYQTEGVNKKDKSPKVILFDDESSDDGISICFDTKFRKYLLHIDGEGHVISQLTLKWDAIYADLLPDSDTSEPLRAFTPWQRHAEANFFNGRSTDKVLSLLTRNFADIFNYDSTSYFKESLIKDIVLNKDNLTAPSTDSENIYLTLDDGFFSKPEDYEIGKKRQPIQAIIKTSSPLRGECISVVPAIYEDGKLHILIKGHQQQTEVVDVFHANFDTGEPTSWSLAKDIKIKAETSPEHEPKLVELNLLSDKKTELMSHVSTAPMVRGSGPGARQYWLSEFLKGTGTVYSEMIVIAEIFNRRSLDTPLASLEKTLNHSDATKSFYRMQFSMQELDNAKEFVFQLTIPSTFSKDEDFEFFYGKDGNKLEETTKLAIHMLKKMVPQKYHHKIRIGINMCCPAASVENVGAGFGLRHRPDFIQRITKAINEVDKSFKVEFKTLMLSHEDDYGNENDEVPTNTKTTSEKQNVRFTEVVSDANVDRLVYQGKPRNIEQYDSKAIARIVKEAQTSKKFQFGFSGMVSAIDNDGIRNLGYDEVGRPHYSVQSVLDNVAQQLGEVPAEFQVMLGRVLLGSAWLLQGYYANDAEIMLHTLLQAAIEREWAKGTGRYGVDVYQIQLLYNVRHITNDEYRNSLISKIHNAQSMDEMIDVVFEQYLEVKKKGEVNILKLNKLEQAIFSALPNNNLLHKYKLVTEPKTKVDTSSKSAVRFGQSFFKEPQESATTSTEQNNSFVIQAYFCISVGTIALSLAALLSGFIPAMMIAVPLLLLGVCGLVLSMDKVFGKPVDNTNVNDTSVVAVF
jgi:hypothetical protein